MYWHIDTDIVSLIVLAAIYVYSVRTQSRGADALREKGFIWCLRTGVIITLIDIAASVVMEVPVSRFAYQLMMILYLISIEIAIVSWFLYAIMILYHDDEKRRKIAFASVLSFYAAYALLVCSNPWNGLFFTLGPDNAYARGPLFFLMVAVYAVYTVALLALTFIRRRHIPGDCSAGVLMMIPPILSVAIVVQLSNPGWLMILPSYMICMVLAFLFLQTRRDRDSQVLVRKLSAGALTDQLTGLCNRAGMEECVLKSLPEHLGSPCLVVVVDLDGLKTINDTMGHPEGDRAICAVGEQLRRHFRSTDVVARFGGDEFVVYLVGNLNEIQVRYCLRRLVDAIASLRIGENDEVALHGSVGAVLSTVGEAPFDSLCAKADIALYHVKRHGKNGYALYCPEMEEAFQRDDPRRTYVSRA